MVAQLLGLKLRLLSNLFRRSPGQTAGVVAGLLYTLAVTVALFVSLVGLRQVSDVALIRDAVTVTGSVIVLGFLLLPLVFGTEDALDPRRFGLFGLPTRDLSFGLGVTGLLGIPSVTLTVVLIGTIVTWSRGGAETLLAIVSAALILVTCVLLSRLGRGIGALVLSRRRSREFTGVGGVVLLVVIAPIILLLLNTDWGRTGRGVLSGLATILGWTPFGAAWSVPGDAAVGQAGTAILKLLLAAVTVWVLWLAWQAVVARLLVTPGRDAVARENTGLGWFDRLPHNPIGAIAARTLTYWARDSRYGVSFLMIPFVPILAVLPLAFAGVPLQWLALVPVPLVCVFLGWSIHNDVAFDSTAIWLHVASGTRGFTDRLGRLIPTLALGIPVIGLGSAASISIYDDWSVLPSMLGVSTSIFLCGLGLSSFTSARYPYPVAKPGDSPFAQPQASESSSALTQSVSFLGPIALALPAAFCAYLGFTSDLSWHLTALLVGVGIGLVTLIVGVWAGGRIFEHRGPDMLAAAQRA
ncbi:hypothetical protein [Cryobacterium sp. CG_9.6]|uniref:hypothetical protein n=1 Tax=Cryobacterium sp. CG_9.6 TaxID=2760710 RepID=UPI0024764801|nr:hypothetical protein [Cryobacterium sp. CG_9.6]MDH6236211.1 ABC-2 type transport system permease protein [Cryobacterium sp. CG_9.6]